ncbi:MAG: alpha/beta hydrolase fold domain-containing protein [Kiritimatiellota bacterium]|nr:alpha/beta hydrolase fold domain-containing protein [Kiritimatiellota bacterium]
MLKTTANQSRRPGLRRAGAALLLSTLSCTVSGVTLDELTNPANLKPDSELLFKTAGGHELRMYVFKPSDLRPGEKRSCVVCIHGGGWGGGHPRYFYPHARYFALRGAVSIAPQYRLTEKESLPDKTVRWQSTVFDCLEDCKSALRTIRQHADELHVDPERIVVIGDSAGGHLAAVLGTINAFDAPGEDRAVSSMANAVINCNGIMDLTTSWIGSVPDNPLAWEGATPLTRVERAKRISPLFNVSTSSVPMLTMHGLDDTCVVPGQARDMDAAMKTAGRRHDLVLFPGVTHAFVLLGYAATDAQIYQAMTRADEFLVSLGYLSGKPTIAMPENKSPAPKQVIQLDARHRHGFQVTVVKDPERGKVLRFDGSDLGIQFKEVDGLGLENTVSVWIKPDEFKGQILQRETFLDFSIRGYQLGFDRQGALVAGGLNSRAVLQAKNLKPGAWLHLVAVFGGDGAKFYLNGQPVGEPFAVASPLKGSGIRVAGGYRGLLDDLRIYNYAWPRDKITELCPPPAGP